MKIRRQQRGLYLIVAATVATAAVAACKTGGDAGGDAPPATGGPVAQATDVTRYGTAEVADTGTFTMRQAVRARKGADFNSEGVEILQPGSTVNRVVRYGAFTLVSWNVQGGVKQGWVETAAAVRPVFFDAGTVGVPIGTPIGTPTTTVPPVVPTVPPTVPPVPTVTTPKPQPTVPPTPQPTTGPKPQPTPTTPTTKPPGFKPPKLK